MDNLQRPQNKVFELSVTDTVKAHLLETARWARFFAVVTIILIALGTVFLAISILAAGNILMLMEDGEGFIAIVMAFVVYIVLMLLYIYPVWSLFKFATLVKRGIAGGSQPDLEDALRHHRNVYKFVGIITIIMLVLYGMMIIGMIALAALGFN